MKSSRAVRGSPGAVTLVTGMEGDEVSRDDSESICTIPVAHGPCLRTYCNVDFIVCCSGVSAGWAGPTRCSCWCLWQFGLSMSLLSRHLGQGLCDERGRLVPSLAVRVQL